MSILIDGCDVIYDEGTSEPSYGIGDALRYALKYLFSSKRRLTIKYYDAIIRFASDNDSNAGFLLGDRYRAKRSSVLKYMDKYPHYHGIEDIFGVPFKDLPLHVNYPLIEGEESSSDLLMEQTAKWRLANGV